MTRKEVEGFLSKPFFLALKPEGVDVDTLYTTFKNSFEYDVQGNNYVYMDILQKYNSYNKVDYLEMAQFKVDYLDVVKEVLLEYLIQEDALRYFCLEDDYERITKIIERKQINSKVLIGVLSRVSYVISNVRTDLTNLALLLNNDIKRRIVEINNNYVIKTMGPLKQKIDKIASGVSIRCYLDFDQNYHSVYVSDSIKAYIKEKSGYDLDNSDYRYANKQFFEKVLSNAIIANDTIWNFEDFYGKSILTFVTLVEKYNDIKHATKILDYAFEEACKDEKIKLLFDNKLPFFLYNIENNMIDWSLNRLGVYLSKAVDFKIKKEELNGFLYPLYDGYKDFISNGKEIFKNFLKVTYPKDYEKAEKEFSNLDNIIQEGQKVNTNITRRELTIRYVLDYHLLGYDNIELKKSYLSLHCKDFLNDDAVLGRLYYRLYIIDKYAKEYSNECIYEYLYEILKLVEIKNNLKSSFALDTTLRESKFQILNNVLSKYGIEVDDKYKDLYIIALLDRKYATAEEAERFAELEQFGDAIYDLAVDNILFYDPEEKYSLDHQTREELVKADAQVKVSKKIGIDKAYISKFNDAINKKYDHYEIYENGLDHSFDGHYLADSLEMVIGTIAKQYNVQKALDFATTIILEANPELTIPVTFGNFDPVYLYNESKADKDYLNKIYPGPFSDESEYFSEYINISYALSKILKIAIIGNDTVDKRKLIAHDMNKILPNDRYDGYYQFVITYLYYGIEETIAKYKAMVESSYSEYLN